MKINEGILRLTQYGVQKKLIGEEDRTYIINRYLELFGLDDIEIPPELMEKIKSEDIDLESVLDSLTNHAYEAGLLENDGITQRDLFDTKLMGVLSKRPSEVSGEFWRLYDESPEKATGFFYTYSGDVNYIRTKRVQKDKKWSVKSEYGDIDISINLSKPEKDPKAIAAAKNAKSTAYPKCQLCIENEGYAGRNNHPARQNHRIIPIKINGERWGFQYSPYVYYNEHCIVLNAEHTPMKIDKAAFEKLFDFIDIFPHYFVGSNADLPIVGGSILSHEHFQGGRFTFAMEKAECEKTYVLDSFKDVEVGIVHWPLSVIRIKSKNRESLTALAEHILNKWRNYTDEASYIFAETDGEKHNTITPIARKRGDVYEMDLALRNNITTPEHPLGLYHPHSEYHNIKKENIGLIEVMGLAILPARLDREMDLIADCLVNNCDVTKYEELAKHSEWVSEIKKKYTSFSQNEVHSILKDEIGQVFVKVLENAGVYKCTPEGREAFERFIISLQAST